MRFTVLASGSSGNATLIETAGFGLLVDAGLGPRQLAARLRSVGATWDTIRAVLLTHVHRDHWNDNTLCWMERKRVTLHCHSSHAAYLADVSATFTALRATGLVQTYDGDQPIMLSTTLRGTPIALRHDG